MIGKDVDNIQGTATATNGGLVASITATVKETDGETDSFSDAASDVHTSSGVGSPVTTDSDSSNDDATRSTNSSDTAKFVLAENGTDSQGNQVHLQETVNVNDSGANNVGDDNVIAPSGTDTETVTASGNSTAGISDTLNSTISSTDPTTGITTTTTDSFSVSGNGNDQGQDNETDTFNATGTISDSAKQTDNGTATANWTASQTVSRTNPDGSADGTSTTTTDSGSDTLNWQNQLTGSPAISAAPPPSVSAYETGSDNPANTAYGATTWSNQALTADAATQAFGTVPFDAIPESSQNYSGPSGSGPTSAGSSWWSSALGAVAAVVARADEFVAQVDTATVASGGGSTGSSGSGSGSGSSGATAQAFGAGQKNQPPGGYDNVVSAWFGGFFGSIGDSVVSVVNGDAGRAMGDRWVQMVENRTGRDFTGQWSEWGQFWYHGAAGDLSGVNPGVEAIGGYDLASMGQLSTAERVQRGAQATAALAGNAAGALSLAGKAATAFPRALPTTGRLAGAAGAYKPLFRSIQVPKLAPGAGKDMLRAAINHLKTLPQNASLRAEAFKALAAQIEKHTAGAWTASPGVTLNGAQIFLGGQGEALVIGLDGALYRGAIGRGIVITPNGLLADFETLIRLK